MRVLVCGGRWERRERLVHWSLNVLSLNGQFGPCSDLIGIQGCASGWDSLARTWFLKSGCFTEKGTLLDFPIRAADWDRYGKGAGPRRNQQMLDEGFPDLVVAGPGGNGTRDMIKRSLSAGLPVISLYDEGWFRDGEARYDKLYGPKSV